MKPAYDYTLEDLDDLLNMACFIQADKAREFAINVLNSRDVPIPWMLYYGQCYDIPEWIPNAFWALVHRWTGNLTETNFHILGCRNLRVLFHVKEEVSNLRSQISYTAPSIPHDSTCPSNKECQDTWNASWWGSFARHYLHPERPETPDEAIFKLSHAGPPKVHVSCHTRAVEWIKEKGILQREEQIIQHSINMVLQGSWQP